MYRLYADMLSARYQESQKDSARHKQMPIRPTTMFSPHDKAIGNVGRYLVHIGHKLENVSLQKASYSPIKRHSA